MDCSLSHLLELLDDFPEFLGLERHINMSHTQGIRNGSGDRQCRTDRASLPDALLSASCWLHGGGNPLPIEMHPRKRA
jgi:hypothetical protein